MMPPARLCTPVKNMDRCESSADILPRPSSSSRGSARPPRNVTRRVPPCAASAWSCRPTGSPSIVRSTRTASPARPAGSGRCPRRARRACKTPTTNEDDEPSPE